ncbi:MAG: transcriptional repressor LexA [Gammaproteobacteria bacterium]
MEKLTPRQSEILALIQHYVKETGYPPTRVEIAQELGFRSPNAAEDHLRALARKGAIEMIPGASRGIRIISNSNRSTGLPLVGHVAAGSPILASENIEDTCDIPRKLFSPVAHYLLRVTGLSMINAGILEGDLVAVHRTKEAKNNDIVIARIGDEVTIKRFRKSRNKILLIAENPDFEPISVSAKDPEFAIEGLSVGVIRTNKF